MQVCTETLARACVLDPRREVHYQVAGVHMVDIGGDTCLAKYDGHIYAHLYSESCYSV